MRNTLNWLHISDIHFNSKTEWRDNIARSSLTEYLKTIFKKDNSLKPDLIFCTGDIAYGETDSIHLPDQYKQAESFFDDLLAVCGNENEPLLKDRLIIVPGNHDINRKNVNKDAQETLTRWAGESEKHAASINQRFNERPHEFKEAILRLDEYAKFIQQYLPSQNDIQGRHCFAKIIDIDGLKIGIAGFNSAWSCAGPEDDRTVWLAAEWQFNSAQSLLKTADIRIGLIHHPVDWLNQTERTLATSRISSDFHFWLHGHSHKAWVVPTQSNIMIAAGAVGAQNSEEFGINLVKINLTENNGAVHLHQRKSGGASWTIAPVEVHAPDGKWQLESLPLSSLTTTVAKDMPPIEHVNTGLINTGTELQSRNEDFIDRYLSKQLDDALKSFTSQPKVWVEPVLCKSAELAIDAQSETKIKIPDLIEHPKSTIIKAPPQFGLTCLARYLAIQAWQTNKSLWLYLDAKIIRPHSASLEEAEDELKLLDCDKQDIKCIILDSWATADKDAIKLLQKVCSRYKDLPVIVMNTIDESQLLNNTFSVPIDREFEVIYLWALSRGHVRKVVADYIESKPMGDEDTVTSKVVSDLEVLNIHRTPLNCLTLLKVSEIDFDESPVNRAEMISRVLFLLFNVDELPKYKIRPDLKDCEYVLGYYCESLIKAGNNSFSREHFIRVLQQCCDEQFIDLEVQVVFDVLHANNILIKRGNLFGFKSVFWIYYFAAQRMHHDVNFANYMFENMRYANYPEIIEFYTGSDRRREDALKVLIKDVSSACNKVQEKCGLPESLNLYKYVEWRPSEAMLEQMQRELTEGVLGSNLPDTLKDLYADQHYDKARPYNQDIQNILSEYSLVQMMQTMKAGAKALRNSDYVAPDIKRQLLKEILKCWDQLIKVLLTLLPMLAERGHATFEGAAFLLYGDFGDTPQKRLRSLLVQLPSIVVSLSKEDIYSQKMGPLLVDEFIKEVDELIKHELILLIIDQRPRGWKTQVQNYITSKDKNSFYLLNVYQSLRAQYRYSYATHHTLSDIEYLIKMTAAKHAFGSKSPGIKMIKKVKDEVIPDREVTD